MIKVCVVLCVLSLQESLADEKFRNILYRIEEFKRQLDRVGWQMCTCVRMCVRTYMHVPTRFTESLNCVTLCVATICPDTLYHDHLIPHCYCLM